MLKLSEIWLSLSIHEGFQGIFTALGRSYQQNEYSDGSNKFWKCWNINFMQEYWINLCFLQKLWSYYEIIFEFTPLFLVYLRANDSLESSNDCS